MEALKNKILNEGQCVGSQIIKVDNFLNHCIDVEFMDRIGREFKKRFEDIEIDKILTVEASGIAVACMAALYFDNKPVIFAKKATPNTMTEDYYSKEAKSFTKGTKSAFQVAKKYLQPGEKILILDDFLAYGQASIALAEIIEQAGAEVAGIGIVIEKGFQGGGERLRAAGYRLESLAVIKKIEHGTITFEDEE